MLKSWLCVIHLDHSNRPGVLARVTMACADRGLNLDEVLGLGTGPRPVIVLKFSASQRLAEYLRRRFLRMPEAEQVELFPGADRRVWEFGK